MPLFQSTPPRGGDPKLSTMTVCIVYFNPRPRKGATGLHRNARIIRSISIHAPAEGRPIKHQYNKYVAAFQSTPPRGGDARRLDRRRRAGISIHAPARGRPQKHLSPHDKQTFQSTPPQGGDIKIRLYNELKYLISIHAPARGRRQNTHRLERDMSKKISIHAPRGGDPADRACPPPRSYFNPRPREGATFPPARVDANQPRFQSTPPRGATRKHQRSDSK